MQIWSTKSKRGFCQQRRWRHGCQGARRWYRVCGGWQAERPLAGLTREANELRPGAVQHSVHRWRRAGPEMALRYLAWYCRGAVQHSVPDGEDENVLGREPECSIEAAGKSDTVQRKTSGKILLHAIPGKPAVPGQQHQRRSRRKEVRPAADFQELFSES